MVHLSMGCQRLYAINVIYQRKKNKSNRSMTMLTTVLTLVYCDETVGDTAKITIFTTNNESHNGPSISTNIDKPLVID